MKLLRALVLGLLAACSPGGKAAISYGPGSSARTTTTTTAPPATEAPIVVESLPESASFVVGASGQGPTTTVVLPEDTNAELSDDEWWKAQPGYDGSTPQDTLACIRSYEGDYGTDTGNGYFGAYQFDQQTWESVGGRGNPADASPAEQDARAAQLLEQRGLAPWPTPSRYC